MFSAASSKRFKASEPLNLGVLSSYLAFIILEKAFEKSLISSALLSISSFSSGENLDSPFKL